MPTEAAEYEATRYEVLVSQIKDEVDTAPAGANYLLRQARIAVREVCKALNWWQKVADFDWEEGKRDYPFDHTGLSFCQMLAIYILNRDLNESADNRLADGSQDDVQLGDDTSLWFFQRIENYEIADQSIIRLKYSVMPRMDSCDFPSLLYNQHFELLRLCMLKNMGSYLLTSGSKEQAESRHMALFQRLLRDEKMRVNEYAGPITIKPYYGTPSDNYGGGGYQ